MFGVPTGTTTTTATGDNNIDGLLSGTRWASTSVSFSFTDNFGNDYEPGYSDASTHSSSFQTLNSTQRTVARSWLLNHYFNVSLLSPFEETGANDRNATIRMAMSNDPGTAYAYYPGNTVEGGDVFFNRTDYNAPAIGNYAYHTFGHELGHALGLKHAHETGGVRNVAMNANRDSMEFSIMSYRSYVGASTTGGYTNETWGYAQSLMMYDISAIQHAYGAWFGSNATNTNYTFSTTTGEMFINGVGQGTPGANRIFRTVWDGNGIDTYDFANYSTNLSIDLTPGGWSDLNVGGNFQRANLGNGNYARGHVFNALQYNNDARSLIENANGGSGNDRIVGNSANNVLVGNAGDDNIDGGAGDDIIYLGAGNDTVNITSLGNDIFYGGTGNDLIDGWTGNETYYGEDGDDTLKGRGGNDALYGGNGVDNIDGGDGDDIADGGDGNDTIYLGAGNDSVNITSLGNDVFYGGTGNDYIDGWTGNETYYGEDGDDTLKGRGGNDSINGGNGVDNMDGGDGIDTVDFGFWSAGGTYNLATGVASFVGFSEVMLNFENITTGAGIDNVTGSTVNNLIKTGAGNDIVNAGDGDDNVDGGDGNDTIYLGAGNDTVNILSLGDDIFYGGTGNDYINGWTGNETYYGEDGDDTLYGQGGNDALYGGNGVDIIYGGDGVDTVDGGDGNDIIYLGAGNDYVNIVSLGNDIFYGEAGDDYINGWTGNETYYGGDGNDTLYGQAGNDILDGGTGLDTMNGGTGNDIYYVDNSGDSVTETSILATEIDTVSASITYTLGLNLEKLTLTGTAAINGSGNSLNNTIAGNSGANILNGDVGNDTLNGNAGNDILIGGVGNDSLTGGIGLDAMNGGTGNDIYYVDNIGDSVTETSNLATEIDTVSASISYTLGLNLEKLTLTGTTAINGSGNSLNNTIAGNSGANTLTGGAGNDLLNGNAGNDLLIGGAGLDRLTGGLGTDIFRFNSKTEGIDTITDFGSGDLIGIFASGFGGGLVAGALAATRFLSVTSGSAATNTNQRFIYNSVSGGLFFDIDGSGAGAALQFATLSTHPTLSAASFAIV
jgi:serralysin